MPYILLFTPPLELLTPYFLCMADEKMEFLGAGCSRLAYSLGGGWCLKKPIAERLEAGAWQNKLEYENFKLGEEEGLVCFPKAKSHSEDWSEIVVEECKLVASEDELFNAFADWPEELRESIQANALSHLKMPLSQFIGFWILGWLEDMNLEAAKTAIPDASEEDLSALVPFKTVDDIAKFLGMMAKSIASPLRSHACLVAEAIGRSQVLLDILTFKLAHPERLYIRDIWNLKQWGLARDGKLVVIDAGYCHKMASSSHFKRGQVEKNAIKSSSFDEFNGEKCAEILSPRGSPVEWKFYTSHSTEYVLSSLGEGRRIKQAGLRDDGLHMWTDKMVFVDEGDVINAMNTMRSIQRTLTPVKISTSWEPNSTLDIQKLVDGDWETQLSVVIQATKPTIGKNVLEFMLDGDQGIVKAFHAGHDVTKLKHFNI